MGVWGAGIFSDDAAADVRDDYRDYLAEGLPGSAATDKLLILFKDSQNGPDDGPPFWLSLAATQFRLGRLEDRVRDRALKIIDDGSDMVRFEGNANLKRARVQVLRKLRSQLTGPQREPAKVRREIPSECDWEPGEVVGYQHASGEWIPLHIQGIGEMRQSRYPIVRVLAIPFEQIERANERTPVRRVLPVPTDLRSRLSESALERMRRGPASDSFPIVGIRKRDLKSERVRRTAKRIEPTLKVEGNGITPLTPCVAWKHLDSFITEYVESATYLDL